MARLYVPLDVNFPDDEKIEAVGLAGAGLFAQALCVCKRTLSDGRITRAKLRRMGADDALIDLCISVGLFAADAGDAVRIAAWLGWNQPAASVLTSEKATQLAHIRHHVNAGKPSASCRYCVEANQQVAADGCGTASERTAESALPKEESESEPTSSISGDLPVAPEPVAGPVVVGQEQEARRALRLYADAESVTAENPTRHAAAVGKAAAADGRLDTLRTWIAAGMTPEAAAVQLGRSGPLGPVTATVGPAEAERIRERARRAEEATHAAIEADRTATPGDHRAHLAAIRGGRS